MILAITTSILQNKSEIPLSYLFLLMDTMENFISLFSLAVIWLMIAILFFHYKYYLKCSCSFFYYKKQYEIFLFYFSMFQVKRWVWNAIKNVVIALIWCHLLNPNLFHDILLKHIFGYNNFIDLFSTQTYFIISKKIKIKI